MNKDLLFVLLAASPAEVVFDNLVKAVEQHKILNTEETKQRLVFECMCFNTKEVIELEGLEKVLTDTKMIHSLASTAGIIKDDKTVSN